MDQERFIVSLADQNRYASAPHVADGAIAAWRDRMGAGSAAEAPAVYAGEDPILSLEAELRAIALRLEARYGTPHLGNRRDPTEEFVYIVLSRKTPEKAYQDGLERLKQVGSWDWVADLAEREIAAIIFGGGLEKFKAATLKAGLGMIRAHFGRADLSPAAAMDDGALYDFLVQIPGMGPKSARCIMLYAFGRPVFPVDAHVGRVLARLGPFERIDIFLEGLDHKRRQAVLVDLVPPDLRYLLRVNLIAHGRAVCRAGNPLCGECVVSDLCRHALPA